MNVEELTPLLDQFGLLPESTRLVSKPRLVRDDRAKLAKVKRKYRKELETASIMRIDALNMTRFVDRRVISQQMIDEGYREPAMLLTFNNDQLALLMAWRDAAQLEA